MVGLVYSANIGGYDTPKAIPFNEDGITYRMYSDTPALGWSVEPPPVGLCGSDLIMARQLKVMMPHLCPGYDWYLWLDATMEIKAPLMPLIEKLLASEHDFAAFKHNEWDCAYAEIDACGERKKDNSLRLALAKANLEGASMPKNLGQAATGVLWRRDTERVKIHAIRWWDSMRSTTMRDQCTFMLHVWNLDSYIEWIPGLHTDNKWIKYHRGHLK